MRRALLAICLSLSVASVMFAQKHTIVALGHNDFCSGVNQCQQIQRKA